MDRFHAVLNGQAVDRVPVYLLASCFSVANAGHLLRVAHDDPRLSLEAQLRSQSMLGCDGPPYYAYATYGTWECGAQREYPSSELADLPTVPYYPVQSEADVAALVLPNIPGAGMLPRAIEFSRLQVEHGLPVSVVLGGAFTIAGNICGLERICAWALKSPETIHQIMHKAAEHLASIVEHWVQAFGPDRVIPYIWESLATIPILSPRHFREFVYPHQKALHERILATGIRHILCHICGAQRQNLPYWSTIPMGAPGIVSVGPEIELSEASHYFPESVLMGNLSPALIQNGTPEQVFEQAVARIEQGRRHPGSFVLASGCEISPESPPQNLEAIVEAARHCSVQTTA